jgi:hypothetical protein
MPDYDLTSPAGIRDAIRYLLDRDDEILLKPYTTPVEKEEKAVNGNAAVVTPVDSVRKGKTE